MTQVKAVLTAIILLFIHFFVPLSWNQALLVSSQILFLMFSTVLLLLSQPRISLSETKKHQHSDKWTTLLILAMASLGLISSILEWAIFRNPLSIWEVNRISMIGLGFILMGLSIRILAIWSLGSSFSATVQIKEKQALITSGLYKYLRHPSYTGAWCMLMGYGLFLNAILGTLLMGIGLFFAYQKRIKTEELTLVDAFGKRYQEYQSRTFRMIPLLW